MGADYSWPVLLQLDYRWTLPLSCQHTLDGKNPTRFVPDIVPTEVIRLC